MIEMARAYELRDKGDHAWVLVDCMWPRGIRKEDLPVDWWARDASPSAELRKWYGHDADKWEEFKKRYAAELDAKPDAWRPILERAKEGRVILVYSSREARYNNAVALRHYLEARLV